MFLRGQLWQNLLRKLIRLSLDVGRPSPSAPTAPSMTTTAATTPTTAGTTTPPTSMTATTTSSMEQVWEAEEKRDQQEEGKADENEAARDILTPPTTTTSAAPSGSGRPLSGGINFVLCTRSHDTDEGQSGHGVDHWLHSVDKSNFMQNWSKIRVTFHPE